MVRAARLPLSTDLHFAGIYRSWRNRKDGAGAHEYQSVRDGRGDTKMVRGALLSADYNRIFVCLIACETHKEAGRRFASLAPGWGRSENAKAPSAEATSF